MPNWCENDLYFSGPEDEVLKFKKLVGLDKTPPRFNFDAVIPYPDDFRQMDLESIAFSWSSKKSDEEKKAARDAYEQKWGTTKDGFNSGGYEWCIANRGTKGNACDVSLYAHPRRGECVSFDTAWTPPQPVIEKLFELFPAVRFELEYFECGVAFCGGLSYDPEDDETRSWSGEYSGSRGG